jgi:AAA15 family ATPase/GTPase
MYSIKIKNYKNLNSIELNGLSSVNLIMGNNNVGKTTLLEAIQIYASDGNIMSILDILDMRGVLCNSTDVEALLEKQLDSFSSLFTGGKLLQFMAEGIQLKAIKEDIEKELEIKLVQFEELREDGFDKPYRRKILEFDEHLSHDPNIGYGILVTKTNVNEAHKTLNALGQRIRQILPIQNLTPVEFVKTTQISKEENAVLFDKIALTDLEDELIFALNIIEPKIEAINFLNDDFSGVRLYRQTKPRVPFVVFELNSQKIRLSSMGDGINRILTIVLALLNAKDGFLLIDEFDSGLHYSVQTKLWKIVYKLSEKLNVQVFATTHSNDCIRSFIEADSTQKGTLIRLEQVNKDIKSVIFKDRDRLKFAVEHNIEIR